MNYDKYINQTARTMPPSGIRKFFDIVAEMKGAISLGVGEPDFITPWDIRNAAIKSIQKGYTQYTTNAGTKELRGLIARYLSERFTLSYNAENEVIVTVGASEAIDLALRVLLEPGDEVLIPDPSYVSYSPCVMLAGGKPVAVRCVIDNRFKLMAEDIERAVTPRTRVLILPYPNNPTGAIMEKKFLEEVARVAVKHDLIVISDEIYAELTYDVKHVSIASIPGMWERTVVVNGFSKAFAMTGWRLGFVAAPAPLAKAMLKVHQYVIMCASNTSQHAGAAALRLGFTDGFEVVEDMRREYDKRRRYMVKTFNDMGLTCFNPLGAFYVFPSVESTGMDGDTFAEKLLKEEKVAVVPGSAFGASGKNFVRCSYAYSMKNLDLATGRIAEFVSRLKIR